LEESLATIRRPLTAVVTAAVLAGISGLAAFSSAPSASAAPSAPSAATAATAATAPAGQQHRKPAIAEKWEAAWNNSDPQRLAALFTKNGARYTDHAFDRTYIGRDGISQWASTTKHLVKGATLKVDNAFAGDGQVAINWTFSGQLAGAPKPFSVPAVAILRLHGNEIVTDDDCYNMKDVLSQSGLPVDINFG
jgi:hypothetical protein